MRFRAAVPRIATSTVDAGKPSADRPILDGSIPTYNNVWRVPPNTVALCGRPAVWFALDVRTPGFVFFGHHVLPRRIVWEQDVGGHLYLIVVGEDPALAFMLEGGPYSSETGALVPFGYPEDTFYNRGLIDFDPVEIAPPHGLSSTEFIERLFAAQRAYDGNQRYLAVEVPFLRAGRDSNSYAIGLLLASGVDVREIPKPYRARRFEWSGYPGAEDPVHRANFGFYLGEPHVIGTGVISCAYHDQRGDVAYVCIAGEPHGTATLPDGSEATLNGYGRHVMSAENAKRHGLPLRHTAPPEHIATRVLFPEKPPVGGANITVIVDGASQPLLPGQEVKGEIVERNDTLGLATVQTPEGSSVVLPLIELGVELRDPKRVDGTFKVGRTVKIGLHRDRYPYLHVSGDINVSRSPNWVVRAGGVGGLIAAAIALAGVAGLVAWRSSR